MHPVFLVRCRVGGGRWCRNQGNLFRLPFLANSGMDFDDLVKTVVPASLVKDVSDILVASGFTSALASQAWELRVVLWLRMGLRPLASVGCRRRRRFGLVWFWLQTPKRLNDLTMTFLWRSHSSSCLFFSVLGKISDQMFRDHYLTA